MMSENLKIQLFTEGIVKNNEREFTKLIGGFGDKKPSITDMQIAELLGYSKGVRQVREQMSRNINYFESGVHLLDLKDVADSDNNLEVLKTLGYSNMAISKAKNIYILSEAGFLLYLKFAEGDKAVELYKDFIEDYFKTKAENVIMRGTLEEEKAFLISEKKRIYGELSMEEDESIRFNLTMEIEKYNKQLSKIQSALDNKEIKIALENQSKLTESKKKMMTQAEFGAKFNNKIGAKNIGKLFKIVGLAKKSLKNTVPYEKYCPKYAVTDINNKTGIASYLWNYRDCLKMIDYWLEDNGHYDEFYALTTKKDLQEFINIMYDKYVENPEKKIS